MTPYPTECKKIRHINVINHAVRTTRPYTCCTTPYTIGLADLIGYQTGSVRSCAAQLRTLYTMWPNISSMSFNVRSCLFGQHVNAKEKNVKLHWLRLGDYPNNSTDHKTHRQISQADNELQWSLFAPNLRAKSNFNWFSHECTHSQQSNNWVVPKTLNWLKVCQKVTHFNALLGTSSLGWGFQYGQRNWEGIWQV